MGSASHETGRALRRIRKERKLSLRDVAVRSAGAYRASAVAAYERGERNMTLDRFCGLCRIYDVDPGRLLGEIVRALEGRPAPVIDVTRLGALPVAEREAVEAFLSEVRGLRNESGSETIAIRSGDVEVLATSSGRRMDEFMDLLRDALRGP